MQAALATLDGRANGIFLYARYAVLQLERSVKEQEGRPLTRAEVDAFLNQFVGPPRMRRFMMAIVGGTSLGKSVLAVEVLKELGRRLAERPPGEGSAGEGIGLDRSPKKSIG